MLKFIERSKTPGMTSKKTLLSLKGISSFAGNFGLIWMKQTLIWFNVHRGGTRNGLSNIKETFCRKFAATNVSSASRYEHLPRLVSQVHMMAVQNVKKTYLMRQIPIKMLKQHATRNSSLHNLKIKIYLSKECRKTSQRWIYVASYVASSLPLAQKKNQIKNIYFRIMYIIL